MKDDSQIERPSKPSRLLRNRWLLLSVALVVLAGATLVLVLGSKSSTEEGRPVPAPTFDGSRKPEGVAGITPRPGDFLVTLSADKLENAQIRTEPATEQPPAVFSGAGGLRTTGTVQANAYKEVPVIAIAGGVVREVKALLGDTVKSGQLLATIFSTELADAQSAYLKALADLDEHHQHHRRTIELVEIGAASREELEQAAARYKAAQAEVSSARQKLVLLGKAPEEIASLRSHDQVNPLIQVTAPASGLVISRSVNPGEVVMAGKELLRVADLSTVWVIGQLHERDFAAVRIGTRAAVTTQSYPGRTFNGRVSYIDPRVEPETRTSQVRVEVSNPGGVLRLGMFVDVSFGEAMGVAAAGQRVVSVRSSAVQTLGARQVVYVATDKPGVFVQRDVTVGPEANGLVAVLAGLDPGDPVVVEGGFLLRAESLKLNPSQLNSKGTTQLAESGPAQAEAGLQSHKVTVTAKGFEPASIKLRAGVATRLTFVREAEVTCATELLIPEYGIRRELPLNQPVVVEFTPPKRGEFEFSCGMKMLRGKLLVQ